MKKILFLMIVMVLIYTTATFASIGSKEVVLNYIGITINIDNNEIIPKDANGMTVNPFIIDGTTYLPVRAISESLGKEVKWNGETHSVYIDDKSGDSLQNKTNERTEKQVYEETKLLNYNNIKIYINNNLIEPKDANGTLVEPFIIDGTTYLPVRAIAEALDKLVSWDAENETVLIKTKKEIAKIENVVVKIIDEVACVEIVTDRPVEGYKYYSLTEPNRLIIDVEDSSFNIDKSSKLINYDVVKQIRFGEQENNVSRVVLDVSKIETYTVVQSEDKIHTYLALNENFQISSSEDNKSDVVLVASNDDKLYIPPTAKSDDASSESQTKDNIGGDGLSNIVDEKSGDDIIDVDKQDGDENSGDIIDLDEEINYAMVTSVKYSSSTNKTKIKVEGDYEYTAFTLSNPDRVVVDIKDAKLDTDGPTEINPNNKNIIAIRFSQNEENVVRIVFDVNSKSDYIITEKDEELAIELEEKSYVNIDYITYDTYSTLILKDTDISYFETEKSAVGNKYYITYSSRKFKSGKGTIEIDDTWVDDIIIKSTKITIYGKEKTAYSMIQDGDDVKIIMKEKTSTDKIILVDAGHGGSDPGACNGNLYEKVYNLGIALKLYKMLQETDGIEVRISRTEDVYINRKGRIDFIKENSDADLVVSIHNNSMANKNYSGTMVLYYNKDGEEENYGITSKEFAEIVKNSLVSNLETVDRGVVVNESWILEQNTTGQVSEALEYEYEKFNIPAIICEVAYVSNDKEVARLQTDKFQQTAAQAIYDGIIETMGIIDN